MISINAVFGEDGIIARAELSKEKTEMSQIKEEAELVKLGLNIDYKSGQSNSLLKSTLLSELNRNFAGSTLGSSKVTTANGKYDIIVRSNLDIIVVKRGEQYLNDGEIEISYYYDDSKKVEGDVSVELYFEIGGLEVLSYEEFAESKTVEEAEELFAQGIGYPGTFDEFLTAQGMTREDITQMAQEQGMTYEEFIKVAAYEDGYLSSLGELTVTISNGQTLTVSYGKLQTEFSALEKGPYTVTATGVNGESGETTITVACIDASINSNTSNWDKNKVDVVISEDNKYVPVPKGYTASTVDGEKSVATGFVIKEGTDGSVTSGVNEFVWVPVPNIAQLYDSANNAGQLWNFNETTSTRITYPTTQNSGLREPDVVTGASEGSDSASGSSYDAVSANMQQAGLSSTATASDFKTQLQNEFNAMKNSVEKYGGFYIGRYETGNLSQTTAVVQKNNSDIGSQTWYTQYRLSKTIKANENVTSSMIWGCQWDATLRWMQNYGTTEEIKKYPTDSSGKGNYNGTNGNVPIPTGSNPSYAVNNIYDMAGNVWDWTIEANDINFRVVRGGDYINDGSNVPASFRVNYIPTVIGSHNGSRATLYVTP